MSEPTPIVFNAPDSGSRGPGDILRRAREAQQLTIEVLASTIKVSTAKLEALEQGQFDRLPDANFTRALAMTVCRALKLDPAAVLAGLPAAQPTALAEGKPPLNQPFKDVRGGSPLFDRHLDWSAWLSLKWMAPAVLLLGALLIYLLPAGWEWPHWLQGRFGRWGESSTQQTVPVIPPAASGVSLVLQSAPVPVSLASAPAMAQTEDEPSASPGDAPAGPPDDAPTGADPQAAARGAAPAAASVGDTSASAHFSGTMDVRLALQSKPLVTATPSDGAALVMSAQAQSWVEVIDGHGAKLLSRHVMPGETVSLAGAPPLSLVIGNAPAIQLSYKGQPVDLVRVTRNNVAHLELK